MSQSELVRLVGIYLLGSVVVLGCFVFIFTQRGNQEQAWTLATAVVTALIVSQSKDRAYSAGAAAGAMYPTMTAGGDPPQVRVSPPPQNDA